MMEDTPGIADVSIGREEGRPEIAVRVDRPKAAMLGMSVPSVATTIQTNVAGTTAAQFRERGNEYPVVVRLREADREADLRRRRRAAQHAHRSGRAGEERAAGQPRGRSGRRSSARTWSASPRVNAEIEVPLSDAVEAVQARLGQLRVPPDFSVGFGAELEEQARSFRSCSWC